LDQELIDLIISHYGEDSFDLKKRKIYTPKFTLDFPKIHDIISYDYDNMQNKRKKEKNSKDKFFEELKDSSYIIT
jgi:hypothetical protein